MALDAVRLLDERNTPAGGDQGVGHCHQIRGIDAATGAMPDHHQSATAAGNAPWRTQMRASQTARRLDLANLLSACHLGMVPVREPG